MSGLVQFPHLLSSNPVPLPDLYFDLFSYLVASIVFGDMDIVSLFLVCCLVCCLERCRLAPFCRQGTPTFYNIPSTLLPQISQGFPIDPHPDEMR